MSGKQFVQKELSQEEQIIKIAIGIFQSVGIKRCIDQIQTLKNQQIYFEICKIFFPQTMIDLFRLGNNPSLTTGQKIQGVITLIAKLINYDLYHIQGQAIAQGKLVHLRNFLMLLEELGKDMLSDKGNRSVQSAPENDKSLTIDDHHSYYTVIGMNKEFEKIIYHSQEGEVSMEKKGSNYSDPNHLHLQQYQQQQLQPEEEEESSDEDQFPIQPKRQQIIPKVSRQPREVKMQNLQQKIAKKTPIYTPAHASKQIKSYPIPLQQKRQYNYCSQNKKWINLIKRMDQTKQTLQKERMNQLREQFIQQQLSIARSNKHKLRQISSEFKARKKVISHKINERQELLNSLKGQQQAEKAIKDLFRQERKVKKDLKKISKQRQKNNIMKIMNFQELDKLLQLAIISNRPKQQR